MGGVTTAYTLLGGLKAVVWSDLLQAVTLMVGLGGVLWLTGGGLQEDLLKLLHSKAWLRPLVPWDWHLFSFNPQVRISVWTGFLGGALVFLNRYLGDQTVLARMVSLPDHRSRMRAVGFSVLVTLGLLVLAGVVGMWLLAWSAGRDVAGQTPVTILAGFLGSLPSSVLGVMAVGVMAATLSSVDSGLQGMTQVWEQDWNGRVLEGEMALSLRRVRKTMSIMGLLSVALGLMMPLMGSVLDIMVRLVNGVAAPLLGLIWVDMRGEAFLEHRLFRGACLGLGAALLFALLPWPMALHLGPLVAFLLTVLGGRPDAPCGRRSSLG